MSNDEILLIKKENKTKGIPSWKYWTYFGFISLFALWVILLFIFIKLPFDVYEIPWSPKGKHSSATHILFLLMPFVSYGIIFANRKKLARTSQAKKEMVMLIFGSLAIYWELAFDITSVFDSYNKGNSSFNYLTYKQFVHGFDFCRLMMYVTGIFTVLKRYDLLKIVVATSMFGGLSTLVDHYHDSAALHSVITHGIILPILPSIVVAMNKTNYRIKDLINAHLLNWTFVIILIIVNTSVNGGWVASKAKHGFTSVAGELTKDRMLDNMIAGWAGWPGAMFIWILAVMALEFIYFSIHRLVYWRTFDRETSFTQTFIIEHNKYKTNWYGFKMWGPNSQWEKFEKRYLK